MIEITITLTKAEVITITEALREAPENWYDDEDIEQADDLFWTLMNALQEAEGGA